MSKLYRAFRLDDGRWVDVLFTAETHDPDAEAAFSVPASSHAADLADSLGVPVDSLTAVEGSVDPRGADRVQLPVPPDPPREGFDRFLDLVASAATLDDVVRAAVACGGRQG